MFMDHHLPKLVNLNEKPKSEDGKAIVPLEKYNSMHVNGIFS